jgi:hypothetical protein
MESPLVRLGAAECRGAKNSLIFRKVCVAFVPADVQEISEPQQAPAIVQYPTIKPGEVVDAFGRSSPQARRDVFTAVVLRAIGHSPNLGMPHQGDADLPSPPSSEGDGRRCVVTLLIGIIIGLAIAGIAFDESRDAEVLPQGMPRGSSMTESQLPLLVVGVADRLLRAFHSVRPTLHPPMRPEQTHWQLPEDEEQDDASDDRSN